MYKLIQRTATLLSAWRIKNAILHTIIMLLKIVKQWIETKLNRINQRHSGEILEFQL